MKQSLFTVAENRPLAKDVWQMTLRGDHQAGDGLLQFCSFPDLVKSVSG